MSKTCSRCSKKSPRSICEACETPNEKKRRMYLQAYGKAYEPLRRGRRMRVARSDAPRAEPEHGRARPKMCQTCLNMASNRPLTGCPERTVSVSGTLLTCGLPYSAEERIERHVGGYSALYGAQKYAPWGGSL